MAWFASFAEIHGKPKSRYDEHLMRLLLKLAENRNLLKNLVVRDLKHRYVGSIGGFLWSVVQPVVQLLTYWFAYTVVFQSRPGADTANVSIPLFLFCGILPWFLFTDTVVRNCSAITENKALITKTVLPAEILPIAIKLSNLVNHAIGLVILFIFLAIFGTIPLSSLAILVYLPMLVLFAQGLGWIVAGLQVFVRDTIQVLQIVLSVWFWVTPVMYTSDRLKSLEHAAMFSPMAIVVTGYRNSLLGLGQPNSTQIVVAAAISAAVFVIGALFFRQTKPAFADVL
jgi:ABC-type polysaccharide/polyol phosphate export permease